MAKSHAANLPREAKDDEKGIQETVQLIGFKLGKEFFGIRIINVQEIIRHQDITMVPRTPEFVEGVISLRGRVIPVINLRKRFSMDLGDRTKETRIVIVELDCGTVGFIVDAVTEVTSIPKASIDPAPPTATGVSKEYIQGVGKMENKLMIILDLNQVLSRESKQKLKQMVV
ncbi:MAG: chemotaxis protein CheW [Nitrospinae bacterium]|nr:chemotaxis protein CheW [Nitrospinota bacterium]